MRRLDTSRLSANRPRPVSVADDRTYERFEGNEGTHGLPGSMIIGTRFIAINPKPCGLPGCMATWEKVTRAHLRHHGLTTVEVAY